MPLLMPMLLTTCTPAPVSISLVLCALRASTRILHAQSACARASRRRVAQPVSYTHLRAHETSAHL
eukprot:13905432-Alexandrium_andersonii.AAC.1